MTRICLKSLNETYSKSLFLYVSSNFWELNKTDCNGALILWARPARTMNDSEEFGFFTASQNVTTGSSMMPQKKNLDVAELLRSKVHLVLGNYTKIVSLSTNLISGYNRDSQDIKKPLMESLEITLQSLQVAQILLKNIVPNKTKLHDAMTPELFATEKALKIVLQGKSFRDAYKEVKKEIVSVNKK